MSHFENLCKLIHNLIISAMLVLVLMWAWQKIFDNGRDSTDEQTPRGERSGITLYTDYGTGCEYLSIGGDAIPRLDANGKHICKKVAA